MADVAVTNTFTNGAASDATAVNTNFNDIVSWVNTNAIRKDGTIAFTAVPSGPASDPSSANQLSRKAYVDHFGVYTKNASDVGSLFATFDVYRTELTVTSAAMPASTAMTVMAWAQCNVTGGGGGDAFGLGVIDISFNNGSSYTVGDQQGWGQPVGGYSGISCCHFLAGTTAAASNNFIRARFRTQQKTSFSAPKSTTGEVRVGFFAVIEHVPA